MINIDFARIDNINMGNCDQEMEAIPVTIFNVSNKLYITAPEEAGGIITQEEKKLSFERQLWIFEPVEPTNPGTPFYIRSNDSELVISLQEPSMEDNVPLILTTNDLASDKRWFVKTNLEIQLISFLLNEFSGKNFSNFNGIPQPGNMQVQLTFNGGIEQEFIISRI